MAITGKGMLCTRMDCPAEVDEEFNRWFNTEHMEERARIPGWEDCRRYVSLGHGQKYLNLYETEALSALSSPAYKQRLANQTDWSKKMMAQFRNMERAVVTVTASAGVGHGGFIKFISFGNPQALTDEFRGKLAGNVLPGLVADPLVLSAHLLEPDAVLSGPPPGSTGAPFEMKWYLVVEGVEREGLEVACAREIPKALDGKDAPQKQADDLYAFYCSVGFRGDRG